MSDKWWSVLFGLVMFACGALFAVAPMVGWWTPMGASSHYGEIDGLFYLILGITGFFFIVTEALLVAFMYFYAARGPGETRGPTFLWPLFRPVASVFNTSFKVEMAWTVVPAIILLCIAVVQIDTWVEVKYKSQLKMEEWGKDEGLPVQVEVSARQFEWRMRYPSPATWKTWNANPAAGKTKDAMDKWVRKPEYDDLRLPNELHVIKDRHVVVQLSTKDVIHSFNMPHMRIKQDALPGKTMQVWFKPIASNVKRVKDGNGKIVGWQDGGGRDPETGKPNDTNLVWEIACAELCGWGHYRMIGRCYVHDSEADFLAWLEFAAARQNDYGNTDQKK